MGFNVNAIHGSPVINGSFIREYLHTMYTHGKMVTTANLKSKNINPMKNKVHTVAGSLYIRGCSDVSDSEARGGCP